MLLLSRKNLRISPIIIGVAIGCANAVFIILLKLNIFLLVAKVSYMCHYMRLFLCKNLIIRRDDLMGKFKFSDETLEHIFSKERTREVPIKYQSIMVHVIEEVLGETGNAYEFQSVGTYEQADISDT
nr:MAG TPA: hypothetical protein [Caudoviricetes sp.]